MIKLLNTEKSTTSGQIYFTIQIDARAANIKSVYKKGLVQIEMSKRIAWLCNAVTGRRKAVVSIDEAAQSLKDYLCNELFTHYVDRVAIGNFIYEIVLLFKQEREALTLAGYSTTYEYLNYEGEDEEEEEEDEKNAI